MLYYTYPLYVLYCTALYCNVPYCAVCTHYCTVLHCTVPYCVYSLLYCMYSPLHCKSFPLTTLSLLSMTTSQYLHLDCTFWVRVQDANASTWTWTILHYPTKLWTSTCCCCLLKPPLVQDLGLDQNQSDDDTIVSECPYHYFIQLFDSKLCKIFIGAVTHLSLHCQSYLVIVASCLLSVTFTQLFPFGVTLGSSSLLSHSQPQLLLFLSTLLQLWLLPL